MRSGPTALALSLAAALAAGCEDPAPILEVADVPRHPVFADAEPLRDGVVVRADGRPPLPDAARLDDAGAVCLRGRVRGTVCAPNEQPVAFARVAAATTNCDGQPVNRVTDTNAEGRFELEDLNPGPTRITITAGQFIARREVEVIGGIVVPLNGANEKLCFAGDVARLAVLSGEYDQAQSLLTDLGLEHDLYCGQSQDNHPARTLLLDQDLFEAYAVVFINCGSGIDLRTTNTEVDAVVENLRAYVAGGGSLYVSDLAADFVERAWPDAVDFEMNTREPAAAPSCCVCGDCADLCSPEDGQSPCGGPLTTSAECTGGAAVAGRGPEGAQTAQVMSPFLRAALGADTFDVVFNLRGWIRIASVSPEVDVLVANEERPLMIQFQPEPDGGRVTYTSFHTHAQATAAMRRILEALVFRL